MLCLSALHKLCGTFFVSQKIHNQTDRCILAIQAALVICGFAIRVFDCPRIPNSNLNLLSAAFPLLSAVLLLAGHIENVTWKTI